MSVNEQKGAGEELRIMAVEDRKIDLILGIFYAISSIREPDELLDKIMDSAIEVTQAERGFLVLYDETKKKFEVKVARNLEKEDLGEEEYTFSRNVIKHIEETMEPILISDAQRDARFSSKESVLKFGLRSVMCVPLKCRRKMVGVIYLDSRIARHLFSKSELDLMMPLAIQAAISIENTRLYKEMCETRDYLNNLVQGSNDGIITMDISGKVLSWNKGAESIFGYVQSEAAGRFPPGIQEEELKNLIEQSLKHKSVKAVEIKGDSKSGKRIQLLVTLSIIYNSSGESIGISAIFKDITEMRKVDKLKSEFLSIISHELRTPLSPIKGYLSLLLNNRAGELSPKQQEMLQIVYNQSNHLNDLINSIIDISSIEAGKALSLLREPVYCKNIIKESVSANADAFAAKEITVKVVESPVMETAIMADRAKLKHALLNLLGNALKFTPHGGEVSVSLERVDNKVKITVEDNGLGISPNYLEKIFDGFFQIDSSYTRASGGIGMGLTVAREIVKAHGGEIWAESEGQGQGTKVSFTVPIE